MIYCEHIAVPPNANGIWLYGVDYTMRSMIMPSILTIEVNFGNTMTQQGSAVQKMGHGATLFCQFLSTISNPEFVFQE